MTSPHPHEITALIDKAAQGDRDAFASLYRLYYPSLYRFTSKFVPERIAEEIATDVFFGMLEGKASFTATGQATFFTWLCTVARNQAIDYLRRPGIQVPEAELYEDVIDRLMGESPDVVHQLEMQEDEEAIRYCIGKLPVEQRVPLLLIYWQGSSLSEVAAELACPEGTIKSRMSTARASLKKCVGKWVYGGRHGKNI